MNNWNSAIYEHVQWYNLCYFNKLAELPLKTSCSQSIWFGRTVLSVILPVGETYILMLSWPELLNRMEWLAKEPHLRYSPKSTDRIIQTRDLNVRIEHFILVVEASNYFCICTIGQTENGLDNLLSNFYMMLLTTSQNLYVLKILTFHSRCFELREFLVFSKIVLAKHQGNKYDQQS